MAQRTDNSHTPKVRPIAWRTAYPHLAEYERTRTPRSTETEGRLARLRRVRSARAARLQTLQASGVTVAAPPSPDAAPAAAESPAVAVSVAEDADTMASAAVGGRLYRGPRSRWTPPGTWDAELTPPPARGPKAERSATCEGCSVRVCEEEDLAAVSAIVDRAFLEAEGYFLAAPRKSELELRQGLESTDATILLADHGWVWAPPKCVAAVRVDVPSGSPEAYMGMLAVRLATALPATPLASSSLPDSSASARQVAPEQQRQGIGRLLVQRAEELARSSGCRGMNLHASSCRQSVIQFYERLGYTAVQEERLPDQVSHLVRPEYNTAENPFMTTHFRKDLSQVEPAAPQPEPEPTPQPQPQPAPQQQPAPQPQPRTSPQSDAVTVRAAAEESPASPQQIEQLETKMESRISELMSEVGELKVLMTQMLQARPQS